jgi:hypothetical protein
MLAPLCQWLGFALALQDSSRYVWRKIRRPLSARGFNDARDALTCLAQRGTPRHEAGCGVQRSRSEAGFSRMSPGGFMRRMNARQERCQRRANTAHLGRLKIAHFWWGDDPGGVLDSWALRRLTDVEGSGSGGRACQISVCSRLR